MDFVNHIFLKKYLSDFEQEHPLIVSFELNSEYMNYVENLLKEVDHIPNVEIKIKEMKNFSNWESAFSELEFITKLTPFNPEFVKPNTGFRSPDIKATFFDEEVFFEVKKLVENDETRRIYDEIWAVESNLMVRITYGALDKPRTDNLINFIKDKLSKNELGLFSYEGAKIEIHNKKSPKTKRTSVTTLHYAEHITYEPIRKKIFMDFYDKLTQFEPNRPIFWVIDCCRWKYDLDDFKRIVYGTIITDATIAKFLPGLSDLIPTIDKIELFNGTNLIPILTYPLKDGLFFLKEPECLNGIITQTHGTCHLLMNPFAKQQLKVESIRELKKLFSRR